MQYDLQLIVIDWKIEGQKISYTDLNDNKMQENNILKIF